MPANSTMIRKLQRAINDKSNQKILINHTQWYSKQQDRPVTMISIRRILPKKRDQIKTRSVELFRTTSEIQVILFLRDLWYELNGWEVPTNNTVWNSVKEAYFNKQAKRKRQNGNESSISKDEATQERINTEAT